MAGLTAGGLMILAAGAGLYRNAASFRF
ncbi:MAG: hypothetical protein J6M38_06550 [Lentisphaeria bacterium]|nr:hypothetical protein [Lentisphaeria bacterium]